MNVYTATIVAIIIILLGSAAGVIARSSDGHVDTRHIVFGTVVGIAIAIFWIIYVAVANIHSHTRTRA
jgi:hypothetical protein